MKALRPWLVMLAFFFVAETSLGQWVRVSDTYSEYANSIIVGSDGAGGTNIFAGAGYGVLYSSDHGESWSQINRGLSATGNMHLALLGTDLLMGIYNGGNGGVFRSSDNATSWITVGLYDKLALSLGVIGSHFFIGTPSGLFRSTDLGENWTYANTGLENTYVDAIAATSSGILAGTRRGVYRSTDDGATWIALNTGMQNAYVKCILARGTTLFAGTYTSGVYRSTDNGAHWMAVNTGLTGLQNLTVPALIEVSNGLTGTKILAATLSGGLYASTDDGSSWNAVVGGLTDTLVYSLAVDGTNILAGAQSGIYRSADNGITWTKVQGNSCGFPNNNVLSMLSVSNAQDTIVYAGTTYYGGIYRSADFGKSWVGATTDLSNASIKALASMGTVLIAAGSKSTSSNAGALYRCTDQGVNWSEVSTGFSSTSVNALAVVHDASEASSLFAGLTGMGVDRSNDSGLTWIPANAGIENVSVQSLVASGTTLFAGSGNGVFRSTDKGGSWVVKNNGLTSTNVTCLATNGIYVFAGTSSAGVFRSSDNGDTWIAVNAGLKNLFTERLASNGNDLVVGSPTTDMVSISSDNGTTWKGISDDLPAVTIKSFLFCGSYLFAGPYYEGVWRCLLPGITSVSPAPGRWDEMHLSLEQNYPNPFNPTTTIQYGLPRRSHVTLTIYNTLGEQIALLVNGDIEAGYHEVKFDAGSLASGVYFYRLQAGSFVDTKKFLLVR